MSANARQNSQRGFSLVECLIATAITAGVIAAAFQSISASQRLARETALRQQILYDAEILAARVRVGFDDEAVLQGFDHWSIRREPAPYGRLGAPAYFERIILATPTGAGFSFELLARAHPGAP